MDNALSWRTTSSGSQFDLDLVKRRLVRLWPTVWRVLWPAVERTFCRCLLSFLAALNRNLFRVWIFILMCMSRIERNGRKYTIKGGILTFNQTRRIGEKNRPTGQSQCRCNRHWRHCMSLAVVICLFAFGCVETLEQLPHGDVTGGRLHLCWWDYSSFNCFSPDLKRVLGLSPLFRFNWKIKSLKQQNACFSSLEAGRDCSRWRWEEGNGQQQEGYISISFPICWCWLGDIVPLGC